MFFLDFSRPIKRLRWLGFRNTWVGFTVGLFVPVVHQAEKSGGFAVGISLNEPYFNDIPALWKKHQGAARSIVADPIGGLEVVADFGRHFAEDCQTTWP